MRDVLFFTVLVLVAYPADAHAYLDPGTGSLIIQTVVASLAAVAYGFRSYLAKALSIFRGRGGKSSSDNSAPGS